MKPSNNQSDNPDYNINFLIGINWLSSSEYQQALHFFLIAIIETEPSDLYYSIYHSYAGLSSVLLHQLGGLHHCYQSSKISFTKRPEVQLNLACAEFMSGNRMRGIHAVDKINALELPPGHFEEFHSFFEIVGKRENDSHGLLKRNRFTHKTMGKLFRKKEKNIMENIDIFIRETANQRYNL